MNAIEKSPSLQSPIMPTQAGKDRKSRLAKYDRWINGRRWFAPDLAEYRDHLLSAGLAPGTVSTHLSTVRARYSEIVRDRDLFFDLAAVELQHLGQEDSLVNRKAMVDEIIARIENATDPKAAPVKTKTIQDRIDAKHLRLTREQASSFLREPGTDTLKGLRDTALLAVALTTGLRESELVALDVVDLRQKLQGELCVHVKDGKGAKERAVPWGAGDFALAIVDRWLEAAGISEGAVFRSFWKSGKLRGRLSLRAVQLIVTSYSVMADGELRTPRPHDLRRTYARRCYEAGMDPICIKQNLGHSDLATTLGYIGDLDASRRKPPALYDFNLGDL